MGKVKVGFFSFTEVTDVREHRAYNEWHLLDHMPEQFPLPGVAFGQRWVRTPERAAAGYAAAPLDRCHYVTLYLMGDPVESTLDDFQLLGEQLRAAGRFHSARVAHLAGPFAFVDAAASARARVRPEAVPYRPHSAIHVHVERVMDHGRLDDELDGVARSVVPAIVAGDGVAGTWSFAATPRFVRRRPETADLRIRVTWFDDPTADATTAVATALTPASGATELIFSCVLEPVTVGDYDWFESA